MYVNHMSALFIWAENDNDAGFSDAGCTQGIYHRRAHQGSFAGIRYHSINTGRHPERINIPFRRPYICLKSLYVSI